MTRSRIYLFRIITVLAPVILLALLEAGLRLMNYPAAIPLFIPAQLQDADREYRMINPGMAARYFPPQYFLPVPGQEYFLRHKPANGYRIFLLGGSTAAAWPYPYNVQFARILKQRLTDTFPEREIEVINTGTAAINSYTLLDFMDEILAQQPDAILIYAGHNEYYGALGAASTINLGPSHRFTRLYLALLDYNITRLLRELILKVRYGTGPDNDGNAAAHPTLMSQVIGDTDILLGGSVYERGRDQFRANLKDIFSTARDSGVPVIISELVSNIRDHAPFEAMTAGDLSPADSVYQQARLLESSGDITAARAAYYRAKDLDAMRFRAPEDFNRIIHELAEEYSVPVVPMQSLFENASPNGLIGNKLMLEHLHPNVEGHLLMSEGFFQAMQKHGLIQPDWPQHNIQSLSYYREHRGVTELDHTLAKLSIMDLMDHWPFKQELQSSGAVRRYQPQSRAEELAKQVFFNNMAFTTAHREMATYYKTQGFYELAAMEYKAILAFNPFASKNHRDTIYSLLEADNYDEAEAYLYQSLKLKDSGFANKWLGLILASRNQFQAALPYLERAADYQQEDPELLFDLGRAYLRTGEIDKARQALADLEKIDPGFPNLEELKAELGTD